MSILVDILLLSWSIFRETAIYLLIGFFIAGFIHIFINPNLINRYLGEGKIRSVLYSAFFGIPIPLCSCGVIPAAAELKQQGANNGSILSFLIATPESGVDSITISYALLDPLMTVIRPVAAFITAMIAGILENFINISNKSLNSSVQKLGCNESCCSNNSNIYEIVDNNIISFFKKIIQGLKYAYVDLLADIGKWLIVGILLGGVITYIIPDDFISTYWGNSFNSMLIMLLAGIPMYVCATASTPIAAALIIKGLDPGAALVFLLAGPATNIASINMIAAILGKRSLLIYLSSIAICSLGFGYFTNLLYNWFDITAEAVAGRATEIFPCYIELGASIILAILLINSFLLSYMRKKSSSCD